MADPIKWRGHEIPRDINGWYLSRPGFVITVWEPKEDGGEYSALLQTGAACGSGEGADQSTALELAARELAEFWREQRREVTSLLGEEP